MSVLTENIVLSRTRSHDLDNVKKLNCWGIEISDVSIVKKMPNVEVLSLSLNKISSLKDFAECKYLKELYLRKNQIRDINEVGYIQDLPNLKKLSLEDNPCVKHSNYRLTILRALPNLELLDNVTVTPEEVSKAQTMGDELVDAELQESLQPEPDLDYEEYDEEDTESFKEESINLCKEKVETVFRQGYVQPDKSTPSTGSPLFQSNFDPNLRCSNHRSSINDCTIYNGSNGNHRNIETRNNSNDFSCESNSVFHSNESPGECFSPASSSNRKFGFSSHQQKGLSKGGRNRSANILSAVLCLIKELDYASLEVVETAIHCRMEEIDD